MCSSDLGWEHRRYPWTVVSGGPGSGIWRSSDEGKTWERLKTGLPEKMGKIGLAVSRANPDRVFAIIETDREKAGLYRSDDGGKTWAMHGGGAELVADHAADHRVRLAGNADGSWHGAAARLIETFEGAGLVRNPVDLGNLAGASRLEPLIEAIPLWRRPQDGAIITGDAIFCQRQICRHIRDSRGHYLFAVKKNQPELHDAIAESFGDLSPLRRLRRSAA